MDSISSLESTELMVQPLTKRLKPNPDPDPDHDLTVVHCPRCDSTNTKFCYYNNYSLTQPRYFCKSCRRYWTKGGTLRNIPIGGVSRKTKKLYNHRRQRQPEYNLDGNVVSRNSIGRQFSYPEPSVQCEKLANVSPTYQNLTIDFMESGGGGDCSGREYEGVDCFPTTMENGYKADTGNTHGLTPFGEMMSYYHEMMNGDDVKPRLFDFDFDWRDQMGCHSHFHDLGIGRTGSSVYLPSIGPSWTGLTNGYGSTSTDSLV